MESRRRKLASTPDEYTKSIYAHSFRTLTKSSFPGTNYLGFAEWLRPVSRQFYSTSTEPHALAVVYDLGQGPDATHCFEQDQLESFATLIRHPKDHGQILFLRGLLSPAWISTVGSLYNVDPEYFRRHMDFCETSVHRHLYSIPSLVSTTNNIMRLCVTTILHWEFRLKTSQICHERLHQADQLANYKRYLAMRAKCGDSLLREYYLLNDRFSIIEQWISISLTGNGRVLVWMDQGRKLDMSPSGPSPIHAKASAFPVIQHHPKMTVRNTQINPKTSTLGHTDNAKQPPPSPGVADLPQSATLLPLEYDSLLALVDLSRRSSHDPLSALIPLFAHAAFSEVQFLNLVEDQITAEVDALAGDAKEESLANLQYLAGVLDRHAKQLKGTIRAIGNLMEATSTESRVWHRQPRLERSATSQTSFSEDRDQPAWPGDTWNPSTAGTFTAKGLSEDYDDLLCRALKLSQRCTDGITVTMNRSLIQESRKAMEESERLKKLTILATLFIPLSFSTSLFGMNLKIFGQGSLEFWWYFVICVPITLLAYLLYLWDFDAMKRLWARRYKVKDLFIRKGKYSAG